MFFLLRYSTSEISIIIIYFPIYRLEIFGNFDSSSFVIYSVTGDRFLNMQFPLPSTGTIRYCESEKNNDHTTTMIVTLFNPK